MDSPAIEALKRARQRISAHGWRQGPKTDPFNGYSLKDAILGKDGGTGTEPEQRALGFAQEACQAIYPAKDEDLDATKPFAVAWNDKPGRDKAQVLTVLAVATGYAKRAKDPDAKAPETKASEVDLKVNTAPQTLISAPTIEGPEVIEPAPVPPELIEKARERGYEVDETWDQARLEAAIATADQTDAKLKAMRAEMEPDPEAVRIKPMPTPHALLSPSERRAFFLNRGQT